MNRIFVKWIAVLSVAIAVLSGCDLLNPTPQFDIDLFIENLEAGLSQTSGFQVAVTQDGKLYHDSAAGSAIYSMDPNGPVTMTNNTRMNVASVSKFIGAIALMQILDDHGISIEESIYSYLPVEWRLRVHTDHYRAGSPFVIRFRNLLRMETGIQFPGTKWNPGIMPTTDQMLTALTLPAAANRWGVYQNGNFTLIRVLIGQIKYSLDEGDVDYDSNCTDTYFSYIKANIFGPLSLDPPLSVAEVDAHYAGAFTRGHKWPFDITFRDGNDYVGWGADNDPTLNGGSGGLVLSSMDLAAILAYFRHSEELVLADTRDTILDLELGLIESADGDHGTYQSKGGVRGPENDIGRALRSRIMFFPFGVEAVVLTNSNISNFGTLLRSSYDNAWQ